ncbi:MAG: TolC family protein [Bacteroidales bacterium]|nr:TolC family protein [Bacteroidales bacterium]
MKRFLLLLVAILFVQGGKAEVVLDLDSCRTLAIKNNKGLQIARGKVEAATYQKKAAFTNYLPELSAKGAYLRNQKNLSLLDGDKYLPIMNSVGSIDATVINNKWTNLLGRPVPLDADGVPFNPATNPEKIQWKNYAYLPKESFDVDMRNLYVGIVTLTQPVYMGGKIAAYNKIAGYAKELAETQEETGRQELLLETDEAYWQVVSLTNKQKLATSYVELLKKLDSDVQQMIGEGVATAADGLSVRVKLNEAEMTLGKVEDGVSLSRMALCQLCGLPVETPVRLADEQLSSISLTAPEGRTADLSQALEMRPELKSLSLATKIYKQKERVALAEHLPNVALMANYLTSNPSAYNGIEQKFGGQFNVGVVVSVPLFHFGEGIYQRKAARIETRNAELQLAEAREKVGLQISQAVFKYNEAFKNLRRAEKNLEKADENLRYANLGFEEGVIAPSGVLEAHTAWLSAHGDQIDAQIEVRLCEVYLNKAVGMMNE